jgi:hypothetical protein
MGGQAYFVAAGMSVLAVLAAWWSLQLRPAHSHIETPSHV